MSLPMTTIYLKGKKKYDQSYAFRLKEYLVYCDLKSIVHSVDLMYESELSSDETLYRFPT